MKNISFLKNLRVVLPRPWLGPRVKRLLILGLWVFGGGALVAFVFGLSFYLAMRTEMRSTGAEVPDLIGLTLEGATEKAGEAQLVVQVVDQRHDPAVPSGRVLQQVPPPQAEVRRGRKLKLVLSLGGEVLTVPDLVGQAARAVEIELRQGGFMPGYEVRLPSRRAAVGTVIAQVPPVNTPAVPNTRIHRLVSDGPRRPVWVMPDLIGLSLGEAERWVQQSGFRAAVRRVRIGGRPAGEVVGQSPLSGYPIRSNDIVELTVAR